MTALQSLAGKTVLLVDGGLVPAARPAERLVSLGAKVHVVANPADGAVMVRRRRFDIALIGFGLEECTAALVRSLEQYGVPYLYCGAHPGFFSLADEKIDSVRS